MLLSTAEWSQYDKPNPVNLQVAKKIVQLQNAAQYYNKSHCVNIPFNSRLTSLIT